MRLPRFILPFVSLLAVVLGAPSTAGAVTFHDAVTDNYKASYNANPAQQELRTWLAMRGIEAAGTRWAPVPPAQIITTAPHALTLRGADGRTATLAVRAATGPSSYLSMRVDPLHEDSQGRWGPLLAITSTAALRQQPVRLTFTLSSGGAVLDTGSAEYRYDPAYADVPAGHIEYNGPGGSWTTSTAPATPKPAYRRARVTKILGPVRTTRRTVTLRVRGRAGTRRITHVRFRVGAGRYTSWRRTTAKGYRVTLPRGRARRVVRVQLRDAAGRTSAVAARRIHCICR